MEEQPPATVTVATGALGPVLEKLTALLGDEQHRSRLEFATCRDIESIRSMLASLHSRLLRIWEREDLGAECKKWMVEARALSYDMEDDLDDLMLCLERSDIDHGELNKLFRYLKTSVEHVSRRCRDEWKTTTAPDDAASNKYSKPSPADPRARFLHKDASQLVGMDRPFLELQDLLQSGDHEMVCIHGFAGTGKTTLADMVYQKIGNEFECRAFVSLFKSPDMLEVLGAILTQVTEGVQSVERTCTEATPEENLIHDISKFLSGKRYLVIVDDIWLWQSWKIVRKALPKGNQLCRIIDTTRILAIAEKYCTEEGATVYRHSGIIARAHLELARRIREQEYWGNNYVGLRENHDYEQDQVYSVWCRFNYIVTNICGGMTLAVWCLWSAASSFITWWPKNNDQDMLQRLWQVLLDGLLWNNPKLIPMVESLRLGYDDLPVHSKTCLLYCSIFPTGYKIERHGLVRKWTSQGFFPKGPEQEMEAAAEACLDELVSRGLLQQEPTSPYFSVHPMMRAFLLWRSKEAKFATCLEQPPQDCPPSYYPDAAAPLFIIGLDSRPYIISASHPRSLVVFGYPSTVRSPWFPWEHMKHVRVLSFENSRDPLCDTDLVAICRHMIRLRHLGLKGMNISVLPPEIGGLQKLETLDISDTGVRVLPKEIEMLHHLETLHITSLVRELPPHHLKTLHITSMVSELPWRLSSSSVAVFVGGKEVKIPRSIWSSPEIPGENVSILLHVPFHPPLPVAGLKASSRYIRVPEWMKQHLPDVYTLDIRLCKLEKDDLEFLRTMPNLQFLTVRLLYLSREPSVLLPEGTGFPRLESFCLDGHRGHMRVPGWVKQHLANVSSLDIRLCQLVDDDLDFLRNEMPHLQHLTLRLEVLPGKAIVITGEGFLTLKSFCLDCRLPLVTFQYGAMRKLEHLEFKFYTSRTLTSEDPMGIRHLLSLKRVVFQSSPRYKSNAPGITSVINNVREEAKEHLNKITISINGKDEEVIQSKKKATMTSANDSTGGSSQASKIQTRPPVPDDENRGNIIPVKSYYPFGVTD